MPPGECYGYTKLWRQAGAEVQNFGVWLLGLQSAARFPGAARALRAFPAAILIAGSGLYFFSRGTCA